MYMSSNSKKEKEEIEKLKAMLPTGAEKKEIEKLAAEKNKEVRENINITLDETKTSVHKTTEEAKKQVPQFTKAMNEYQEESIEATRDIAENFLESQKQVIIHTNHYGYRTWKTCRIHTGHIGPHRIE